MSGIQKQLLPFFIQDYGERTTDKKICMFRSMVAATEDVFRGEDTYLDRSKGVGEFQRSSQYRRGSRQNCNYDRKIL